jgi:hypothetical protein
MFQTNLRNFATRSLLGPSVSYQQNASPLGLQIENVPVGSKNESVCNKIVVKIARIKIDCKLDLLIRCLFSGNQGVAYLSDHIIVIQNVMTLLFGSPTAKGWW